MDDLEETKKEPWYNRIFQAVDDKFGPSKASYKPACRDVRDMLLECVLESDCMKESGATFK